ncbi:MAG: DUF1553 domain-containing protein [Saprospiraceae bacterium]
MPNFIWRFVRLAVPVLSVLAVLLVLPSFLPLKDGAAFYSQEVKPILNKRCISCHGGVKQNGGFSMMKRRDFFKPNESGVPAIDAGNLSQSELLRRIAHPDPEERMPLDAAPLSAREIRTLKKWVRMGAPWGTHWAYQPVQRVPVPTTRRWAALFSKKEAFPSPGPIDAFIEKKLRENQLSPNPRADKATLLRRVSLDLTGLPAPPHLADAFLKSTRSDAYATLVDSLLASPRYGEKWASVWLDIARYADSKGYEKDNLRDIWRYRDWLIQALNQDMPYDQFLREQIAGDLLPNADDAQFIATAFHRNTPTNDEGGTSDEEYRNAAVIDRVNTTFEGLLSTSFACTQCHGHPYEDFSHADYYRVLAFFNNTRDEDTVEDYPLLRHFPPADSLRLLELRQWIEKQAGAQRARELFQFVKFQQPVRYAPHTDRYVNSELYDTKYLVFRKKSSARLPSVLLNGETRLILQQRGAQKTGTLSIHLDSLNGPVLGRHRIPSTENRWDLTEIPLRPVRGRHDLYFRYENPALRADEETGFSINWFYFDAAFPGASGDPARKRYESLYWELLRRPVPGTPVLLENPAALRRETRIFERGNWMVKGASVTPGVPAALGGKAPRRPDRLGLADWLADESHPLTARTLVNRVWEQVFGTGIVETLEDFGSQGTLPSHPELLEYLSWQFMHTHTWSVKALLREIALSETYCQSAHADPDKIKADPGNRLLARAPRVRLSAEQLRDQALAAAGLLSPKMYGPSVMPYQPEGIWASPYDGSRWVLSTGEDRYRRAVYTLYKRSSPYPSQLAFDGAMRNVCTARRIRTNTPLQALVTLNDPAFMEAAVHLGYRMQRDVPRGGLRRQVAYGYRRLLGRDIPPAQLAALEALYHKALPAYKAQPALVCTMDPILPGPESAALALVANALLNLDEAITKP